MQTPFPYIQHHVAPSGNHQGASNSVSSLLRSHTMIDTWPQRKSPNALEFEPSILRFHTPTDTWLHRNSPNAFAIEPSVFRCNLGCGFLGFTTSAFILVVGLSYDPNPPSFNSLNSVLLSSVDSNVMHTQTMHNNQSFPHCKHLGNLTVSFLNSIPY